MTANNNFHWELKKSNRVPIRIRRNQELVENSIQGWFHTKGEERGYPPKQFTHPPPPPPPQDAHL